MAKTSVQLTTKKPNVDAVRAGGRSQTRHGRRTLAKRCVPCQVRGERMALARVQNLLRNLPQLGGQTRGQALPRKKNRGE